MIGDRDPNTLRSRGPQGLAQAVLQMRHQPDFSVSGQFHLFFRPDNRACFMHTDPLTRWSELRLRDAAEP